MKLSLKYMHLNNELNFLVHKIQLHTISWSYTA